MGKSLTETAKAVLAGQNLQETANAESLKPKSKASDAPETLGSADKVAEAPVKAGEGSNVGAAAATKVKEDKSAPKRGAKAAEPAKKVEAMTEEEDFGDIEISEELAAFIDQLVAEGKSEEEIAAAIEENFELVEAKEEDEEDEDEEEDDEDEEDADEEEDDDKEDMKESYQVDMSEHVDALFAGEDLSEDFKAKATTIFEAAVKAKMAEEIARLEEAWENALAEEVEKIAEELSANVDDYLNYVVENWVADNEIAIETSLRTELTEDFIAGLRNLFAEHYIDIPEDKVSVVEELAEQVEALKTKLNEEIEQNVELTKALTESVKVQVMHDMTEGLTTTQAEKLKELAEGVEYANIDEFAAKVQTLRESYFPSNVKAQASLDTIEPGTEGKSMISEDVSNPMSKYVRALGKSLPK